MDERLRHTVRERAGYRCEYCWLPQDAEPFFVGGNTQTDRKMIGKPFLS